VIRATRDDELELLLEIERLAGRAFLDVGMPEIAAEAATIPGDAPRVAMRRDRAVTPP